MGIRLNLLWPAFIRLVIGVLLALLAFGLFLAINPRALRFAVLSFPIPGHVDMPALGPVPPEPVIDAPEGDVPRGYVAFTGKYSGGEFACGFLLRLEDGRWVGISAAHATPLMPLQNGAWFETPGGERMATLTGQVDRGRTFLQDHFSMDYVLWNVASDTDPRLFLKPDPRGAGQPGEKILVYGRFENGAGGSRSWPGVIMSVKPEATWVQLEDSFSPYGFSGCPVVSQHTGRVIGMAVAGHDMPPVVLGLHPVGSIVEKAEKAVK